MRGLPRPLFIAAVSASLVLLYYAVGWSLCHIRPPVLGFQQYDVDYFYYLIWSDWRDKFYPFVLLFSAVAFGYVGIIIIVGMFHGTLRRKPILAIMLCAVSMGAAIAGISATYGDGYNKYPFSDRMSYLPPG